MKNRLYILLLAAFFTGAAAGQETSVRAGDVALSGGIGVPHLMKNLVKLTVKTDAFKDLFNGQIEVGNIKGLPPAFVKGEYTFSKWFALGFSYASWKLKFDITDYYNAQNITVGNLIKDSSDVYKITLSSASIGIRPVLHFNLKNRANNLYFAFAWGIGRTKLSVDFRSTDIGRSLGSMASLLDNKLSIPGLVYLAPVLGYRHYFSENLGFYLEAGYDKGALLMGGLALRLATKSNS